MIRKTLTSMIAILMTASLSASVADGDAHWAKRATGASGAKAAPTHVDAAISAYEAALAENPEDLEARWKLLRALRFKGSYVLQTTDEKREIFDRAKEIGRTGVEIIEAQLRSKGVRRPDKADPSEIAKVAKSIPEAGPLYYWDAVNWGEWALVFGKLAAVRQGAAGTIRREAEIALEIDPAMQAGGPGRVLGRLYNQTPRVPFITGWASDERAVEYLTESLRHSPGDKLTTVFLAEALVAADRANTARAKKLLREVIEGEIDPAFAVEEASAREDAKALLARLR